MPVFQRKSSNGSLVEDEIILSMLDRNIKTGTPVSAKSSNGNLVEDEIILSMLDRNIKTGTPVSVVTALSTDWSKTIFGLTDEG